MAEKNKGKVDPVAIRELISQGIPMKKKESEMAASAVVEEKKNDMTEVLQVRLYSLIKASGGMPTWKSISLWRQFPICLFRGVKQGVHTPSHPYM